MRSGCGIRTGRRCVSDVPWSRPHSAAGLADHDAPETKAGEVGATDEIVCVEFAKALRIRSCDTVIDKGLPIAAPESHFGVGEIRRTVVPHPAAVITVEMAEQHE